MTHEEKLKEITKDLRSKLPRLTNIEKGCFIRRNYTRVLEINSVFDKINSQVFYAVDEFGDKVTLTRSDIKEVIGKEPILNDVLEWLFVKEEFDVSMFLTNYFDKDCWDFSKPYLKDQSEAHINLLYDLL